MHEGNKKGTIRQKWWMYHNFLGSYFYSFVSFVLSRISLPVITRSLNLMTFVLHTVLRFWILQKAYWPPHSVPSSIFFYVFQGSQIQDWKPGILSIFSLSSLPSPLNLYLTNSFIITWVGRRQHGNGYR